MTSFPHSETPPPPIYSVVPSPQVFLLQALLRGNSYPRTRIVFDALAEAGKPWDLLVAAPLARIEEDPLFRVDEGWTLPQFQPRLAGMRIPMPRATSVESMLCAHGNRRATWHAIFECGEITSRQVCEQNGRNRMWAISPAAIHVLLVGNIRGLGVGARQLAATTHTCHFMQRV